MYIPRRIKITMNDYLRINNLISGSDAIIIGAGAGLSTSAGINYGREGFQEKFPELVQKYGMTDMYTSSFYPFKTEEERWSYWAKHINYLYNVPTTEVYKDLYEIVKNKPYFVVTTNVDGQFLKAGFDRNHVFEVQGTLAKMQCSRACHDALYDDLELVSKMFKADKDCCIPTKYVPICPRCGEAMDVNLRKDEFFVEDQHWHDLQHRYLEFVCRYQDKKLLLIELGVGFNTPGIIRFLFEKMTRRHEDTTLIRVNKEYPDLALNIQDKKILIQEDCKEFIRGLNNCSS